MFKANPYYFKVDSMGQQLPYIDRVHERFLNADLQTLAILNGEIDYKAQGNELQSYPTLKENEAKGGYTVLLPAGSIGSSLAFNITHADPKLRAVYGDLRFRQAVSHAINREEMNQVLYFGLGKISQALPANLSFATEADADLHDRLRPRQGERSARRDGDEARRRRHAHLPRRLALHHPLGIFLAVRHAGIRQADDRLPQGGRARA